MKEVRTNPWILVSAGFHEQGGQAKATAALADYLLDRGTPVHLVAHDVAPRLCARPGCSVHRVGRPHGSDFLGVLHLRRRGRAVARQLSRSYPGTRVVANGGSCAWGDINWIHYLHSAWRPSLKGLPLRARIKELVTGAVFRRHERRALTAARVVVVNSERVRVDVINHIGIDPSRVHTVYYGGEGSWRPASAQERAGARAWLRQPEGRPLVVFVGGFGHDERKGFDTLWGAWRELCLDPCWDADLIAAGDGVGAAAWRRRIADAGLSHRLRLIGFTDRIYDVLAAGDLLVSPTRYEPYGLNVQEAICRGLPVLVSARAGATERFPRELDDLVLPDPEDARDLAARLRCWRTGVPTWRTRVAPLSVALRRHGWHDMAARLVALVEATPAILSCRSGAGRVPAPATLPVSIENSRS